MNRVKYSIVKSVSVKDSKGNVSKEYTEVGSFWGSDINYVTQGQAAEFGFDGRTTAKLITRSFVAVNSFIKHKDETFHVLENLSIRGINTLLLRKV